MSLHAAGPPASIPTAARSPEGPSALAIAWCLAAGFFLLLAPVMPRLWGRVASGDELLRQVAALESVRIGVSGLGLALLMMASWDLATTLVTRWTR